MATFPAESALMKRRVTRLQEIAGVRNDGIFGPKSRAAVLRLTDNLGLPPLSEDLPSGLFLEGILRKMPPVPPMAWGAVVSYGFRRRVHEITYGLKIAPDDLMNCMAFESAESFSPTIKNMAGSGATGLIQFMPRTMCGLLGLPWPGGKGEAVRRFEGMTDLEQLSMVYRYFYDYRGRLENLGDVYMAILYPRAIGREPGYVLFDRGRAPTAYRQNLGLDLDRDGGVERWEAVQRGPESKVEEGNRLRA